tara:strand:+ start:766 stop:1395 length:630 start_codon:yes stop_codon:yes gene_type:complete
MLKYLKRYFTTGLVLWIPIVTTVFIISFIIRSFDSVMTWLPQSLQPNHIIGVAIPGLGLVVSFIIITLTGMLTANFVGKMLLRMSEKIFETIPFVKQIYSGIKKSLEVIFLTSNNSFQDVVLIEYPKKDIWSIAFVTNYAKIDDEEMVSVFIPTTPNPTSGFIYMLNLNDCKQLNCSVEDALKYVISLGTLIDPKELVEPAKIDSEAST